jgi:NAD(P)-dependent dehydrogenase (short-subunit alcohol dehydrogenase family)
VSHFVSREVGDDRQLRWKGRTRGRCERRDRRGHGAALLRPRRLDRSLANRNTDALQPLAAELTAEGRAAVPIQADVARDGDVERAVELAAERYGGLDVAFNNAAIQGPARPLAEQTSDGLDWIVDVNLKGIWRSMRAELPAMLERGGAIVNTASVGDSLSLRVSRRTARASTA